MALRDRGLFLCSNRVTLEHPYYNTVNGRREWDANPKQCNHAQAKLYHLADQDKIMVEASIDLPKKFESLLSWEKQRAKKHIEAEV